MNPPAINSRVFEFSFPQFDTLVQVEEADGAVVIRTTRDTFSEERKACFVRELAAEGFISEELRWLPGSLSGASRAVRWLVDRSSFMPEPGARHPNPAHHGPPPRRHRPLLGGPHGLSVLAQPRLTPPAPLNPGTS